MSSILKVSEIQDPTNGNSALTVDSSGRVLTPARPSFLVYVGSGDASDLDYSSVTAVNFDTKQHDIGNGYDLSADKYTVPVSGVYHLSWQVRMQNVTDAAYVYSPLYLNGSAHWGDNLYLYGTLEDPQGGTYQTTGTSITVELSASDELKLNVQVNADSSSRVNIGNTFFSGFLVG